jgi:Ca2+-transporting ATPase
MTFATLVITNLALILANRSRSFSLFNTLCMKNVALWWVIGGALALLMCVLYVPFLQKLFYFKGLSLTNLGVCFIVGILMVFALRLLGKMKQFNVN